ncbi:MAG TPA: matrixin family metalloprotease [Lacipirellulaceae bacterium]|nr:matrixin family metalloprotease [Lacipirellulaceae bacterium]
MGHGQRLFFTHLILAIAASKVAAPALGFVPEVRWGLTASGPAGEMGDLITLTWSIVPDGTVIQGEGPSNFIQFLDGLFGAGDSAGSDLSQRPWFSLISAPFDRWSELSGMTFVYEPHDDGSVHGSADGLLGVRGDVRVGGADIDGTGGTLAYIYFPSNSDLVIDTADAALFRNRTLDHRALRNAVMHELGHGFGLAHVASSSDALLMEPAINITFDGPQLDDIRGIHAYYGDALERSGGTLRNDTPLTATDLGLLYSGATRSIGADAAPDPVVDPSDVDFVSIANHLDSDFFSFEVNWPMSLNAVLMPRGGSFSQGIPGGQQSQVNASADNDLRMTVFDSDGVTVLASADDAAAGEPEVLAGVYLPTAGQYFVQVTGSSDAVQLYQLDLSLMAARLHVPGDYNGDGIVDAADYVVWRKSLAEIGLGLAADVNQDSIVDGADYGAWRRNYGLIAADGTSPSVPEPAALQLAAIVLLTLGRLGRRSERV